MRYQIGVWMVGLGLWGTIASAGECVDLAGRFAQVVDGVNCVITVEQTGCEKVTFSRVCDDGTSNEEADVADGIFRQLGGSTVRKSFGLKGYEVETVYPFLLGDKLVLYSGINQRYVDGEGSLVLVTKFYGQDGVQTSKETQTLKRMPARR